MFKLRGLLLLFVITAVFLSGCDNNDMAQTGLRDMQLSFDLDAEDSAWLRDYLPNETVAYLNVPTPWNYLFDAKADAMHAVQSLPEHQQLVAQIKQGAKDNYFQYIPTEYHDIMSLFFEHIKTSLEVAVINHSPAALLPTVAVGTRLQNLSADELDRKLSQLLQAAQPGIELKREGSAPKWTMQVGQFPAFVQYEEAGGRLLIYGGMGAKESRLAELWDAPRTDQLVKIKALGNSADPSGLNLKAWVAVAKIYELGGAFVPPEQQQRIAELGLDQAEYVWMGFESTQGQSAMALHVLMPDVGWRLALPKATDWFDVELAGEPRSVLQLTLPTADQLETAIEHFKWSEKLTEKDREELEFVTEFKERFGFEPLDLLRAYYQQIYWVKDQSGSWYAMKIKDRALHEKMEAKLYEFFDLQPEHTKLAGQSVWQVHFSIYQKLFESSDQLPKDAEQISQMMNMFKDHAYWYEEDGVFYMSAVPQVLAEKQANKNPVKLSTWLANNQGSDWQSAILAYGKDIKHMPQDLYHFYLLMLQGLGDLAQVNVDLYSLPTASELNLPDSGRINLMLSSDAEKVSVKFGYEYSFAEGVLSAEGGMTTLAVLGILAAYAIPAYKDYTVRAEVMGQMSLASGLKMAVAEHWVANGTLVGVAEAVTLPASNIYLIEESGTIAINLEGVDSMFDSLDEVYLVPDFQEGYVVWSCESTIKSNYLPPSCR